MSLNVRGIEDVLIKYLTIGLVVAFETEHDRTSLQGYLAMIVFSIVVSHDATHVHREVEFDVIALLPTAVQGDIVTVLWI